MEAAINERARLNIHLNVRRLGQIDYQAAWRLQEELAAQRLRGEIGDTLLLLEHPPTLTLGRKAHAEHLLASREELAENNVAVVDVDRGGDITYHGPGQLVGYPILNLREGPHRSDLHLYLRGLEEALIRALAVFGIAGDRFPGYTGVWTRRGAAWNASANAANSLNCLREAENNPHKTETNPADRPEKIAAIGIKFSRWITSHGFALNVCPDMAHFDWIVPCGIREYGVTSMSRILERPLTVPEVMPQVAAAFCGVFDYAPPATDSPSTT